MKDGLDGVVATETALSHVDGEAGELIVRGRAIESLVGRYSFEDLAALLWRDLAEPALDEARTTHALAEARVAVWPRLEPLLPAAADLSVMEGLRFLLAALGDASTVPHHLLMTAAVPVATAGLVRQAQGAEPLPPSAERGHAADFLAMLRGEPAPQAEIDALDAYLVTTADHGLNASTFTARVVASTRAGTISAVVAALGALKGPLHGGAPGPVLDMLDEIGDEAGIVPWLERQLAAGERLMGFGHRVYRVRDPRADVLKGVVSGLAGTGNRIAFAEAVEAAARRLLAASKPGRRLDTNVELHTALLLEALRIPREAFTAVFATARVAGWTAHVLEQERHGRLIRPLSRYVGPAVAAAA